jgi:hypothetical protein
MLLAPTFFTLLVFIIINFLILFLVKTRATTVVSLIIAHLVCVLFFSISIANSEFFKEIVLALIVYSMVILFLISNEDLAHKKVPAYEIASYKVTLAKISLAAIFFLVIFSTTFSLVKNLDKFTKISLEKKSDLQNEIIINQVKSRSHSVHIAVKKFYLEKTSPNNSLDKIESKFEHNEKKLARVKDKLLDNFLFKRSSDMIVIIVAISSILLLLSNKKINKSDESL